MMRGDPRRRSPESSRRRRKDRRDSREQLASAAAAPSTVSSMPGPSAQPQQYPYSQQQQQQQQQYQYQPQTYSPSQYSQSYAEPQRYPDHESYAPRPERYEQRQHHQQYQQQQPHGNPQRYPEPERYAQAERYSEPPQQYADRDRYAGSQASASAYTEPAKTRPRGGSSSSASSSTSSSLLNVSAKAPRFGGVFSTFWRAPSEQRERRRRKKQKARIFFATNSSSSSVNSDLAYGRGYIERDKSQGPTPAASAYASPAMYRNEPASTEVRQQPPPPAESRPKTDDEEILEIGRQLQDIARRQNESDKRAAGKSRASQLAGAAGIAGAAAAFGHFRNHKADGKSQAGPSSKVQESSSDDDWESASEDESSTDSSDSSDGGGLAYGFDKPSKSARISAEPPEQIQPPGRKNTVVDPRLFGPYNSLRGAVKSPCGFGEQDDPRSAGSFRRHHEETVAQVQSPKTEKKPVQQPMQHVYPVPTSDPDKFDFDRASVTASRQDLPQQSRPAPVPLQQPKPIVPVSSKVYDADRYVEPRTFKRQAPTGRSPGRIPVETAIAGAGAAAAAIGVAMANRRDSADHVQRHDERRKEGWERRDDARESLASRRPDERVDQPVKIEMDDRERRDRSERRSYRHSPVEIIDQRDKNRAAHVDAPPEPTKKPEARPDARPEVYRLPKGDEIRVEYDPEEDRQRREKPKEPRKEERKPEVVEERRDAKRVEKQTDLPRDHHGVEQPEVPFTQAPIDPFQFQVADDAFQTPKYATPKNATPKRPLTPQVVTVDREPNFDDSPPRKPDYSDSRMSRKDSFELEQRLEQYQQGFRDRSRTPEPRRRRDSFEEEKHAAKAIYDEVKHATAPVAAAALASAIAVEEQRSRKHRSEHVTEDGSRTSSQAARDAVQEEADRHYRETVLARKIAEDEIRSRSSSPHDGSVVGKYDDDRRPEVVTIVTPPEMDHPHDKSPYDAPNADVRIDHVIIPDELARFRLPEGQLGPGSTHIFRSRDPSCERERPLLNLVLPTPNITPRATPAPEQQKEANREASQEEKPKKSTREVPKPRSVEVTATPADVAPEVVPEPKQKVVERPTTPTAKSVTWGENETKSFEIESPEPPKTVPSSTSPKKSKKRFGKSTPWDVIAAAIGGAGAAAAATSEVRDPFEENKTTENRDRHSPPQSPKSRAVEPSSEPIVSPIHPKVITSFEDDLPPAPGPKPSSPQTSQMPGAFADDLEFASVLAAGLQDTGFDPNIVIDNPTYMRRDSPPGQNEPIYQQPYVETVNDLGIYGPENIGQPTATREPGHVIGEVQDTPVEKDLNNGHAAFDTLPRKYRDKGKSKETEVLHEEPAGDESEPGGKLSKKEKRKQKAAKRQSVESAPEETSKAVTPLDPFSQTAPEHDWNDDRSQSPSTVVSTVVSVGPKVRDPLDDPLWNSPSFSYRDRPVEEPAYDSRRYVDEPTYHSRRSDEEPTYHSRRSADEPTPRRQSEERRSPPTTRSLDDSPYAGTSFDELPSIQDTRSFDESSSLYSQPSEVPSSYVRSRGEPSSQAPASSETPNADDDAAAPTKLSKKEKKKKRSSRSDIVVVQEDGKEPQEIIVEEPRSYREELPEHNDTAPTEPREKDDDPLDSPVKKKKKSKKSKQSSDEWTDVEKQIEDVSAGGRSSPTKPVDNWDDRPAKSRRDRSRIDDQDTGSVVSDSTPRRSKSDRRSNGSRYEDDDVKSVASDGSSRKRRSRDDKKSVKDDDKKSTKEEEKRGSSGFFSLFRPGSGNKDTSGKEEKSFLDNAGTLGAGAGLASAVAALGSMMSRSNATEPQPEESEHSRSLEKTASTSSDVDILDPEITQRTIRPAIDPQYGDLLPLPPSPMPPSTPGPPTEELDDLPALPDSRPETPPEERRRQHEMKTHVRRRSNLDTPHKSPSQTAVPFKLRLGQRSSPSSPGNLGHVISPMTSPTAPTTPENALSRRPSIRPFSWESSKEIKPLYLLEQARQEHAAHSTEPHVDFPELPPSEPSSRESPAPQFALRENDVEYFRQLQASPFEPDELRVNTDVFRSPAARDQFSSQETTPKAEQALHHTGAMYRLESPALPVVPDLSRQLDLSERELAALSVLPASPASTVTEHEAAVPAEASLERAVADLPALFGNPESQPGLAENHRGPVFLPESPALPGMPDAARQLESFEYEPMDLPSLPASPVTEQALSPVMQFHDAEDFPAVSAGPLAEDQYEAPYTVPKFLPGSPALPPVTETHRIDLPDHYFEALPVLPASPKVEPRASPKSVRFAPESPALPVIPDPAEGFSLPARYLDELPALPSSPVAEYQPIPKGVSFAPESAALPSVVDAARLDIPDYDLAELPSLPASPVLERSDRDIGPKFAPESPALPAVPDTFRDAIFPVDSMDQLPALPGSPVSEHHEPVPTISYAPESPSLPTWPSTGFRLPEQLETDLPALPLSPVLEQQDPPAAITHIPESPSLPTIPETFRHFDTPAYNVDELPSLPATPVAEHEDLPTRYTYAPESPALPSFPGVNIYFPEQQLEDLPSLPGSPLAETEESLKKLAYAPESPALPSVPDAGFNFPEQQLEDLPSLPGSPVTENEGVSKKFIFAPESPALPAVSGAGFYVPEQQLEELPALPGSPPMGPLVTDREEIAPPRVIYAPESPALPSVPDLNFYFQEQQLDDLPSLPGSPAAEPLVTERGEPAPSRAVLAPESPALPSVQEVDFHFPEQSLEELPALPSSPTTEPLATDREEMNAPRITFAPESPALPPQADFYFPEQPMEDLPALPSSPVAEPKDHPRGLTLAPESPALPHPDAAPQLYAFDHQLEDLPALPTSPETLPAVGTQPEPEPVEVTSKDRSSYLLHMTPPSIVKNLMERDLPDTPPSPTRTRSLDRSEAMAKVEEESLSNARDVALGAVAGGAAAGLATTILGHDDQTDEKKQSDPDTQSLENFGIFEPAEPLVGTKLSKKAKKKKRKSKALSMDENTAPTEAASSSEPPAENAALPSNDIAPVSPIDKDRRQSIDAPREMLVEEPVPPSGEANTKAPAEAPSTEAIPSEVAPTSETRSAEVPVYEETLPTEAPSAVVPPDEVSMPRSPPAKPYQEDLPSSTHTNLDAAADSSVLSTDDTPFSNTPREGLFPPVESIQREAPSADVARVIESLPSSANDNVRSEDTPGETQPEMPTVESKAPIDAEALEMAPLEPSTADVPAEKKLSKKDKKKLKKAQARALELEHSAKPEEGHDQIESATEPVPDQLPEDNFIPSLADDTLPAPETEAQDSMVEVGAPVADADAHAPALEADQADQVSQLPEPQAATWLSETDTTVPASVPQTDEPALLPGTDIPSSAHTSDESKDINEAEQPVTPSVTEPSSPETKKTKKKKKKAKKALDLDGEAKPTTEATEDTPVASEPVTPFPEQEVSAKLEESRSTSESIAPIAPLPDAESQLQQITISEQDDNQLARGDDVADLSASIEEDVEKTARIDEHTSESKPAVEAEEKPATLEDILSGQIEDAPTSQDAPADGQPSLGPQIPMPGSEEKSLSLDDHSTQTQTAPGEDEAKLGNTEDDLPLLPTLPADDVQPAQEPTSAVRDIAEAAETSPTPTPKGQNLSLAAENEHVEAEPVFEQETLAADVHADLAKNPELSSSESRGLGLEATPTSPVEATSDNVYSGIPEDNFPKGSQPTTSEAETAQVPAAESCPKEDSLSTSEPIDNVPSTTHSAAELPEPGPASTQMPSAEPAQPEQSDRKKKKKKKKKSKGPSLSQLDDILSMENTPVQTPTTETPPVVRQAAETPSTETPAVETPLVDNPVVETPIVETPAGETIVETPAVETRDFEAPVVDRSVVETPIVETPTGDTTVAFDKEDTAFQITPAPARGPDVEPPASNTPFGETTVVETPVIENPVVETPIIETPTGETTFETPAVGEKTLVETPADVEFATEETTVVVETPAAVETQIIETPAAVETPAMVGAPEEKAPDFTEEPAPDTVSSIEKGSDKAQGNDLNAAKKDLAVTEETQELPSSTLTESVDQADNASPLQEPSTPRKNEVSESGAITIIPQDESMEPAATPERAPVVEETATKAFDDPEEVIREPQEPANAESNDEAFATPPQRPISIETEDDVPGSLSQEPTLLDSQIDAVDAKPQEPFIEKEQPRGVETPVEPDSPVESKKSKKKKKKAAAAAAAAAAALQAAIEDTPGDQKDQKEANDETITDKDTSITQDKTGDTEAPPPELPTSGEFATDVKISEEADAGPAVTKKGKKKKKSKKSSTLDPEPENSPSTSIPESTADVANTMDKSAYVSSPPREPVSDEARFPPAESSTEAEPAANTGEQRRKSVTWAPELGSAANNSDLPLQEAGHGSEWQPEAATAPPPATGELQTTEPSQREDRSEAESLPLAIGEEMQGSDQMAVDETSEGVAQKDLDPESQAQRHPASESTQALPQQHEHEHAHDIAAAPIDYFPSSSGLHATRRGATRSDASIPTAQQAYFPSAHRMLPATGSSSSGAANRKGGETLEGEEQAEQVASSEADATSDAEHAEQAGRSGAIGKPSATAGAQTGEVGTSDPGLHAIVEPDSGPGHDKSLVDTQNGRMTDAEPVGPALTDSALEAGGPQNTPVQPLANQDSNPKIPQPLPSHAASSSTSPLDEVPSPRLRPRHTPSSPSLLERAKNSDAGIIEPAAAAAASAESRPEDFNLNDSPDIGDSRGHKAEEEQHPVPRATDAALPGQTAAPESLGEFIASEPQVDSSSETVPGPEPTGIVNAGSTTQSPDDTETQPEEGADVWSEPATPSNMSKKDKKKAKKAKAAAGEPDDVEDTQARDVDDGPSAAEPGASAPIESSAQPEPASIPDAASAPGAEDIALWAGDDGWAIQPNSKKSKKDKKKKRAAAQAADEADAVAAQPEESSSKSEEIVAEQAPPSPPAQDERSPSLEDAVNEHQTTAETSDVPLKTSEAVAEGVLEDVPGVSHVLDAPHDTSAGDEREQPQPPQEADDAGFEVPTKKSKKNKKKQQQQQSSGGEEAQGSLQEPTQQDHQPGHGESTSTPAPAPPVDTLPADAEHLQLSRDPQPLDDTLPEDSSKTLTQEDTLILDRPEEAPNPASVSQPPPAAEAEVAQEAQTMPSDSIADTTVLAEDEFPVVTKKSKKDKKKKKKGLETPDEPIVTPATELVVEQTSPPQQTPAPEPQPTPAEVPAVDEPASEQVDSSEPARVLEPDAPSSSTPMPAEEARPLEEEPISPKKSKKDKKKKKEGASADILAEQPLPTETETTPAPEAALTRHPEQMVMPETESTPLPTDVFTQDATTTTDEPQTLQEEVVREQPMDTTPDDDPVRQESSVPDTTVDEATQAVISEPSQHEDPMDLDVAATEEVSKADVPPVAEATQADTVLDPTQTAEAPQPVTANAEDEFPIPEKKSKKDKKKGKKAQEAQVEPALEAEPQVEQSLREEIVTAEPEPARAVVEPVEEIPIFEEQKTPVQEPTIIEASQSVVAEDEFPLPDKKAKKSKKKKGQALDMIEPQPSAEPAAESAVNPVTKRPLDSPLDTVPSAEGISLETPTDTPANLNDVREPAAEAQDIPLPHADTPNEDVALEADKARSDQADTFDIPEGQSSLPLDDEPSSPKLSKKDKKKKKKAKLQDDSNVLSDATPTVEVSEAPQETLPSAQEAAKADLTAPPLESTQPPEETPADLIESRKLSEEVPADPASNSTGLAAPATLPVEDSMDMMLSQSAEADVVHTQEPTAPQPEEEVPLTPKKSKKDKKKKKKGLSMDDAAVEQDTSRSLPVADGASDDLPAAANLPAAEASTNIPSEASIPASIEPVVEKAEFQDEMDIDVEPPATSTSDAPVIATETLLEPAQPVEEIVPVAPITVDQPTTTPEPKLESVNDVPSASLGDATQTKEAAVALPEDEWPETLPAKKSKKDKKKKKSLAQYDLMASEAATPAEPAVEEVKEDELAVSTTEEAKIPDIAPPDVSPDERNLSEPLDVDANMGLVREMERPHSPADKIPEKQETAPAEEKRQDITADTGSFDPLAAWTNEWSSAPTKKSKKEKKKKKRQNQALEDAEVAPTQEDDVECFKPESEPFTAADSINIPPTIAEPSDAISNPPSPARSRTPALAEQSILSVRSRSPDLKEHSVLSRRSESPDLAERSLLSGRSRTPNYAEQSILSGHSRSPNYTEGSPRSRRTRSPGYTEGSPRSRRSRSPGYTDGSFLTRRSRSPNYAEGSPRSRRSRSPGFTDGSFLTRRSRSPTYGDRSLLSGRSRSRNYTERSLLSRRSRSPNYTEGSFLTRRSQSPNYTEHSLLSRRSRRSRSPNYTEHSILSERSRSPNYAERSMLSTRSRSPDFVERSTLSERPLESVVQEDNDRESGHDNSTPQSPATEDRARSSASHRQDVNVDADGSRPASPTAALDNLRSMDLPEATRSSLNVVDLGSWDVPVTKKSKKGKKGKKQSIPIDVESPQNIDPTPAPNPEQSLAPEGADNVGYFDKEPLEENRSASAPPPPETASTLLTPADTPRPVDATTPSPESSRSADVDLTPAQETSRVIHEVPYEQPDKRKKLKTREQSNTLLPEPIFSSRDIAAVDLEGHDIQENNAAEKAGTIADESLLPTSAPDASGHQGHPEPSVDKQVPEHPSETSSALDIAASYLEHKTHHDPIETTRVTTPEKQHQDTGSSRLGVAAGTAAIAAAAATLAKSSSAKKKGKESKYADKRSQEDDLFDDLSLWQGADKKHVSEAANAEVEKFWGGEEPQSASAQEAPAEPDTTKDEGHHKRQDTTMREDDVFAPNTEQRDGPPIRQNPVESGELQAPKEKEEYSKDMPSLTAPLMEKALDDNVESPVLGREEKPEEIPSATERDTRQSLDPEPSTMTSDLDEAVDRGFEAESRRDLSSVLSSRSPEPFYETGGFRSPAPSILPPVQEEAHEEADSQPRSLPKTSSRRALRTPEPHRDSALSSGSSHPFRKSGLDSQVERDSGVMRDWQETSSQGREAQRTPELSSHRERRRSREAERAKSPSVRDLIRRSPFAEDETRDYPMSKTPVLRDPGSRQLDTPTPEPHKMRRISPELERKRSKYQDLASAALAGAAISSTSSPRSTPPPGNRSVSERVARLQSPAPVEPPVARRSISNTSLSRHRRAMGSQTPEPLKFRPESPGIVSRPATATPPLRRRTDRRMSGDLRSLSQRSQQDLTQDPTSSSNTPVANEGRVRTKDMADVFDGFGEGRIGSPRSPTRPHSMRRRQSMQVLELESRVEQLLAENRMLADARTTADTTSSSNRASASGILAERDAEIDVLKQSLDFLQKEVARLTEVNEGLNSANAQLAAQHNERYRSLETQHADTSRQLDEVRNERGRFQESLSQKDAEISKLRSELDAAKDNIRQMQRQILAAKGADADFLNVKDVDHFDHRCQQLCSHVQQWVLRFSKFSDMRACRLTNEINDEKVIDRLDNAILDGTDVDAYLADRVRRRDVFMSMTMNMIWEFVFTRYLFGMDREQRQKLKSLEKLLTEVGPPQAVRQWRAVTLTLLSKRPSFKHQRDLDTEAVVQAIFQTLSKVLPPPSNLEDQIQSQLRRVMREAVDLSIEMRTQRAEYMMLPPLQPEYDADGELAETVTFNAALMNERSGDKSLNNESLEGQHAVVRIVLFPLVVKKGDDAGNNDDEIVVCPAQVLVARPKGKSVRLFTPGSEVGGSVIGGNAAATHSELSMGTFLPEQASNVRSN